MAPGVRVRASSRGVRTSIGPRAARVHFGSGRNGVSTGAGPVTYYTGLGGSTRRSSRAATPTGTATANRQLAAASRALEKAEEAQRLAEALQAILNVHRGEFGAAQRPVAPEPPGVDVAVIRQAHMKRAKATTSVFSRAARKSASKEASRHAEVEVAATTKAQREQHAALQAALDERWEALNANEHDAVLVTLAEAFEDNEAAAAAIGVDGAEVSLVVVVPSIDSIPDRRPTTTSAGNLSLKKLTKRETSDFYKLLVCGHALVTVKEAFAAAPAIISARVVAVRPSQRDAYGGVSPEVVLAARFERFRLAGIRWADADAARVVNDANSELISIQRGATQELAPVDLTKEPELAALVGTVDFEELIS
jgi:hypothetical protein